MIPLEEWTHLAMTFDGDIVTTYVNGQVSASLGVLGPLNTTTDPLRVGSDVGWDRTPNGRIDDVRIWGVARTQDQIIASMDAVQSDAPGLIARWTFSGGSLEDLVSDRAGTLVGDAIVVVPTTPTGTPSTSPTPTSSPIPVGAKGDVNCDQRIDIADTLGLLREVANTHDAPPECTTAVTPTPTPCPTLSPTNCDVPPTASPTPDAAIPSRLNINCDTGVNGHDGLALLAHVAGIDPGLPGGCDPIGSIGGLPTPTPTPTPEPPR